MVVNLLQLLTRLLQTLFETIIIKHSDYQLSRKICDCMPRCSQLLLWTYDTATGGSEMRLLLMLYNMTYKLHYDRRVLM